jgi:hypothetical protein
MQEYAVMVAVSKTIPIGVNGSTINKRPMTG